MTVDCPELNLGPVAESISLRQTNEIIIAVPIVDSSSERKPVTKVNKRIAPIISFEEDDPSMTNNNIWKSSTPPATVSLADACLKYQEKRKLANEKSKPFITDSTYERLHAEPINMASSSLLNETEYIEEESPTAITIINPVTHPSSFPSFSNSYDYKETDSSMSKATDSSSITSNTTTHSSNSPPIQIVSQPSQSTSMSSSISSVHSSPDVQNSPHTRSSPENEYVVRIQELTTTESEHILRIQELEKRCACLEERVTALTL